MTGAAGPRGGRGSADQGEHKTAAQQERLLHKDLGFWHLTAISFSGIIGSGWLLGALNAAKIAGPESLIAWLIGGIAIMLIALVMVELGASRPESGGLVRWPYYSNGRLVATIVGWGVWISYATNPPSESAAMLQYASKYVPGIYQGSALTGLGILLAGAIMALFVMINWYGVRFFATVNGAVTVAKFAVPLLTILALFASGFHARNFSGHGGFTPYGYSAGLSAITTAGIIYAYTGFQTPIDLSGEARNPKRDIPSSVIAGLALSTLVYLLLQGVFIGVMPGHELVRGWNGVNFDSPFAQLAVTVNLSWLSWVLYADAIVSPGGSALTFTAATGRESYAMGKNRFLPAAIAKVDPRSGVPRRALLANFVIGMAFLLPLPSWQSIVAATSVLALFAYSASSIAQAVFDRADPAHEAHWIPGIRVLAPVSFVVATLILYWSGWTELKIALPTLLVAVVVYAVQHVREGIGNSELSIGAWLVVYLVGLLVMSVIGSFGGDKLIAAPWDSIIVGLIGALAFWRGVANGVRHVTLHPAPRLGAADTEATAGAAAD
jgi:amino acid transporter